MTTDRVRGRDPWQGWAWLAVAVITPAFFVGTHASFLSRAQQFRVALAFGTIGLVVWVVDARRCGPDDQEGGIDRPLTIAYMTLTFVVVAMAILWEPVGPPAWFVVAALLPSVPSAVGAWRKLR